MVAETGGNLLDACAAQEADGGITQEGHHRRSLPFVEGALVLAEGDILRAMQVVLDAPVVPFEREEACWWSLRWCEAGDAIVEGVLGDAVFAPGAREAEDLPQARPGQSR